MAIGIVRCGTSCVAMQRGTFALAFVSVAAGCTVPTECEPASVTVEERLGSTTYEDSILMSGADSTAVAVRLKSGSEGLVLSVELQVPGRLLAVDGLKVMAPRELVRIERWRSKGNLRPLTLLLELHRCDSVRLASVEFARDQAARTWIRYSSQLRQTRSLPRCCESTSRGSQRGR